MKKTVTNIINQDEIHSKCLVLHCAVRFVARPGPDLAKDLGGDLAASLSATKLLRFIEEPATAMEVIIEAASDVKAGGAGGRGESAFL